MALPYLEKMKTWLKDSIVLHQRLLDNPEILLAGVEKASQIIAQAFEKKNKVFFCGNGGSAADAQHLATEFIVRYKAGNVRQSLPALALTADSSLLTACGNDFSFDDIFSRQVEGLGNEGDVLFAISTSGNSQNIINAVQIAHEKKMNIIKLLGKDGGKLKDYPGLSLTVPAQETSRIQEVHIMIGHFLCELVENRLYGFE